MSNNPNLIKNGGEGSRVGKLLREIGKPEFIEKAATMVGQGLSGNWFGAVQTLMKNDSEVTLEQEQMAADLYAMDLQDLISARAMYKDTDHRMADDIAKRIINYNLWVVFAAIIVEILVVIYVDDKVLIAIISGAVGSFTTALLQERQQVVNFFFGSSRGSKAKQKELNK